VHVETSCSTVFTAFSRGGVSSTKTPSAAMNTRPTPVPSSVELIPLPAIQQRILLVRDRHVMLDEDLARLYGVETRSLVQRVTRNRERFPPDFERETTTKLGRHDEQLDAIFRHSRQLISSPAKPKRPIGFSPPRRRQSGNDSVVPRVARAPARRHCLQCKTQRPATAQMRYCARTSSARLAQARDTIAYAGTNGASGPASANEQTSSRAGTRRPDVRAPMRARAAMRDRHKWSSSRRRDEDTDP
jgi:ORF6N domain